MEEKTDLQNKVSEGYAFSELRTNRGWRELCLILKEWYANALLRLSSGDDADSRARIKVIEDIIALVDDKVSLGEQARQELTDGLFIKHGGTG